VKFNDKAISWDDFEISGSSQLEIILSNTAGKIAGSVLDADGKQVLDSSVTLIPTDAKIAAGEAVRGRRRQFPIHQCATR